MAHQYNLQSTFRTTTTETKTFTAGVGAAEEDCAPAGLAGLMSQGMDMEADSNSSYVAGHSPIARVPKSRHAFSTSITYSNTFGTGAADVARFRPRATPVQNFSL